MGHEHAYCHIRKNGAESHVFGNTVGSHIERSNSVVLHLVKADVVDLDNCTALGTFFVGWETSFSGFLLQED